MSDAEPGSAGQESEPDSELAEILRQHADWLASDERRGARADLSRARLDGIDLSHSDLSGAVLRGASLNGANLRGIRLTHSDLGDAALRGADLTGADLLLADFSGADLSNAKLKETISASDKELGHVQRGPRFRDAVLRDADLTGAYCRSSDFSGCQLEGADLSRADLRGSTLSDNDLQSVTLAGADLSGANLARSRLNGLCLDGCRLADADLSDADLADADVSGANLQGANLQNANVHRIRYDRRAQFRGVRVASCYGSSRFRRFAQDQDYLEEFREAHLAAYRIWLVLTDCGRSMSRVVLWSLGLTLLFAAVYLWLGEASFAVSNKSALGWDPYVALYYSVVTFTTLGFGDVTPITRAAAMVVMIEVVVGYVMLGILISILATKVARRS